MRIFKFLLLTLIPLGIINLLPFSVQAEKVSSVIFPIQDCYLGAVIDGKWVEPEKVSEKYRKGNLVYQFYTRDGASAKKSCLQPSLDPETEMPGRIQKFTIDCQLSESDRTSKSAPLLGISGDLNPLPRKPNYSKEQPKVYKDVLKAFLQKQGIKNPMVKIEQMVRVDLEGDGQEEVLIEGTYFIMDDIKVGEAPVPGKMPIRGQAGWYSVILLRKIIKGKVQTIPLMYDVFPSNYKISKDLSEARIFNRYQIKGLFDIDGDGVLEVFVASDYYEGDFTEIVRLKEGKPEVKTVCGWGA